MDHSRCRPRTSGVAEIAKLLGVHWGSVSTAELAALRGAYLFLGLMQAASNFRLKLTHKRFFNGF
jgi:hypothetical protein